MLHGKAKVEYEPRQIRHAVVQCPKCQKWFYPRDITTITSPRDLASIMDDSFLCPLCREEFVIPHKNIEETSNMPKAMIIKSCCVMEE